MCNSIATLILFTIQLVKKARFREVGEGDIWDYFADVMAPDIKQWQGQHPQDHRNMGDLILEYAKAAPFSKVNWSM